MDRLNVQAHKNAMNSTDEYVMDSVATLDKMKVLIYDLLCTEVWKAKVCPLLKSQLAQINSVRSYITVSHFPSFLIEIQIKSNQRNFQNRLLNFI